MLRATLRSLLSRKLRLVLSALAVVLGVMAVSGALVVTDTIGNSFDELFRSANENVAVRVDGQQNVRPDRGQDPVTAPVPAALVGQVGAVPGVAAATGEVNVTGTTAIGPDGKVITRRGPPPFGVAWHGEDGLFVLRSGTGPDRADQVAISANLAENNGFAVGDPIEVVTSDRPKRRFTVAGIFGYSGDRDTIGGETRIAFTEPVAQAYLLGRPGVFSSVDVTATDGVSQDALAARVRDAVGPAYRVRTGEQVSADEASATSAFLSIIRTVLLGFAGVALFVGAFLILNTFSILVAQRTAELALYRALGASRAQVIRSVLVEAVAVGLIAATLGLGAGIGVAAALKQVMQAVSGARLPGAALTVPALAVVAAYGVGVLVTAAAAVPPAWRASAVAPRAAMRTVATPDRPLTRLTVAGAVPTAAGAGALAAALAGDLGDLFLPALLAGVLLVFVGVAMLTPAVSRPVVSVLGRAVSWSTPGSLGRRNSGRNPRRTAITAAALMVGVALVTGVGVLASSLKSSIERSVSQDLAAQLVIAGEGGTGPGGQRGGGPIAAATFDPAVLDRASSVPGVVAADGLWSDIARLGGGTIGVSGGDVGALRSTLSLRPVAGELRTLDRGEVVVDETFATDRKLAVGDRLPLVTQRGGPGSYTVVGVYARSELLSGPVLAVPDAVAGFRSGQPGQGYLTVAAGADPAAVQRAVAPLLADNPLVSVQNQADVVAEQASQVDTFVLVLYLMLALAIVIAVLGIVNTLALSVLERTRELGLVRAVGMGRGQVTGMVTAESVVIAVFGALLGVLVGVALGSATSRALADRGVPELSVPWSLLGTVLVLSVLVGLVAGVLPAIRAARTDVLSAIAYE